jgi:DNA-directed RNA polymerase specialized sigma24 family protein
LWGLSAERDKTLIVDFDQVQTTIYWSTEVKMLGARLIANQPTPYATGADFCRIFEENMSSLYLLAFLLTGERSTAEKCFVRGLDDSGKGNPVFRQWAHSWARRTIVQSAIQMIRPRPAGNIAQNSASKTSAENAAAARAEIARIAKLPVFERFAFVMSVLESYSDQECSLLLGCTRADVVAARTQALQQMGRLADLDGKLTTVGSEDRPLSADPRATSKLRAISHLAVSA